MKLVFLLTLISAASAVPHLPLGDASTFIVGGELAGDDEFPHSRVSIRVGTAIGYEHLCGGVVYDHTRIITTAGCANAASYWTPGRTLIWFGNFNIHNTTDIGNDEELRNVDYFIPSENWSQETYDNDIGIIILRTPLVYNDHIQPIQLANSTYVPSGELTVVGYGGTDSIGKDRPSDFRKAVLNVINNEECDKGFKSISDAPSVTQTMFCASAPGKSVCLGDQGSSLIGKDADGNAVL